MLQKLLRL